MSPPAASPFFGQRLWQRLAVKLRAWTGIVLSPHDAESALSGLFELAAAKGLAAEDYLRSLEEEKDHGQRQLVIDRLAIGTTWFMRESAGISALVQTLLREIGAGGQVRVWSAGCSTGQEPYGLAMALLEAGLRPRILATDINREALRTAVAASYPARALAAVPAEWRQRHTTVVRPELIAMRASVTSLVTFAVHNLALSPMPPADWGPFDAVVCRNVLIYFDRGEAIAAVRRLSGCCRPGGYILLSAAEHPLAWMTHALKEPTSHDGAVLLRSPLVERAAPQDVAASMAGSRQSPLPASPIPKAAPKKDPVHPAAVAVAAAAPTQTSTKTLLAEATHLMEAGALVPSLQLLNDLLAREPLLAAGHLARGLVLKRTGALKEAAAALRCARFLFSDEAWLPPYHLALVLEQLGEPDEACEAYRHALAVVRAGVSSGLSGSDGAEEALLQTIAEACRKRIHALGGRELNT